MGYLFLALYLLVGFQLGARLFSWGRKRSKSLSDFIIPLILVPLVWPIALVDCVFDKRTRKAFFEWEG